MRSFEPDLKLPVDTRESAQKQDRCRKRYFALKWHTAAFGTTEEIAAKEQMEARIIKFWQDFAAQSEAIASAFHQNDVQKLVDLINAILKPIHEEMMWEVSCDSLPSSDRLVLTETAEDNFGLRPLNKAIIDAAPEVNGWRFTEFKVPLPGFMITSHTGVSRDFGEATGTITETPYGCFDLTIRSKNFRKENDLEDWHDIFLLCPSRFGEELFEVWVDGLFTAPDPVAPRSAFGNLFGRRRRKPDEAQGATDQVFQPLAELASTLALAVAEKVDNLPAEPCWQRQFASTTVMQASKPDVVGRLSFTAPYPEVISSYANRFTFHSANFTRYEEKFAYLKMVGSFTDTDTLEKRYALEEEIDRQLRAGRAGCVTGGGIGNGVSFIDLMISDLPAAVEILRSECSRIGLPETSWLVFLDTFWADEWVGMSENSPAPPARESKCW